MPHIHTNPGQHDHTASAFILRTPLDARPSFDNIRLLVHMHKKFGVLLQPGGHIELNETPWDAINHEIQEETGFDMEQLYLLQPNDRYAVKTLSHPNSILHPIPFFHNTHDAGEDGHRHTDITYLFVTNEEPRHELAEDESQDLRWLTLDEIMNTPANEIAEVVKDAAGVAVSIVEGIDWNDPDPDWQVRLTTDFK